MPGGVKSSELDIFMSLMRIRDHSPDDGSPMIAEYFGIRATAVAHLVSHRRLEGHKKTPEYATIDKRSGHTKISCECGWQSFTEVKVW
jgi:hypothetical protein